MTIASIARYALRAGFVFPFLAILAFVADKPLSQFLNPVGFGEGEASNLSVLRDQYAFLQRQGLTNDYSIFDFQLFELFIWIALVICMIRILGALLSSDVLEFFRNFVEKLKVRGRSTRGAILFFMGVGFLAMVMATNFAFDVHSDPMRSLMTFAPRAFICLAVMLFCWGSLFFTEGALLVFFLVRERIKSNRSDSTPT